MADKPSIIVYAPDGTEAFSRSIARTCELTESQTDLLEDLTGNEYKQALSCGGGFNGHICLVGEVGIDEFFADGFERTDEVMESYAKRIYPDISAYDFVLYGWHNVVEGIEWSKEIADIFIKCDSIGSYFGDVIEIAERNESEEVRERRFNNFVDHYRKLTPYMAAPIKVADFRHHDEILGLAHSLGYLSGQMTISPDGLEFEHTFFHEAAHLTTSKHLSLSWRAYPFENDWMLSAGEIYVGDAWDDIPPDAGESEGKTWFEDGFLNAYSGKNMLEDLAELTAFIYTTPGYVGWATSESQKLWEKINFLYEYGYIHQDQMIDVLERDYSYIEDDWKKIAGAPVSKDAAEEMSESELLEHGLLAPAAVTSVKDDILFFLGAVEQNPCWLREAAMKHPLIAAKLEYLYANRMLTGKQYDFLTADELPEMPDLPYCAQPPCEYAKGFWDSIGCYLGLAIDKMKRTNAFMTPL
jgi:hypothetical protein